MTQPWNLFSVILSIIFLLVVMMPKVTRAHSPKKEGSRIRRSVTPLETDHTHSAPDNSSTPESFGSSKNNFTTQVPETSAKVFTTQTMSANKNASDTQDHPAALASTEPHSAAAFNSTNTYTVHPQSFGGVSTNSSKATIKPPFNASFSPDSSVTTRSTRSPQTSDLSNTSHDANATSNTSRLSHAKHSNSPTQPNLPVTSSLSHPRPTTPSGDNKASNASSSGSVAEKTTVAGSSGDSDRKTTTNHMSTANATSTSPGGLHPMPHPKVTDAATTANATNTSAGGLPPLPHPKVTDAVSATSKPPPLSPKNDCPMFTQTPGKNQSLVSNCLIAIASLAAVATFFMVCSIVLCTRLSAAKHRYQLRWTGEGTEMVCISALLPDGDGPHTRPKIPKSNGALIPITDLDSDCGDNLTLNSFLPDGDRV